MKNSFSRREFLRVAGLLTLASIPAINRATQSFGQKSAQDYPNVLIVILDALSALNMSLYKYVRRTTPKIEEFAQRATVFHNHYAGGSFTTPGVASLLTGTLPWTHHAYNLQGMVNDLSIPHSLFSVLPGDTYSSVYSHNLLAITLLYQFRNYINELGMPRMLAIEDLQFSDRLFKNDYNIAFSAENIILRGKKEISSSLFLSRLFDKMAGNKEEAIDEQFQDMFGGGVPNQDYVYFTMEESIDWTIDQVKNLPNPFFAYYHYLPPHGPYRPRIDFSGKFPKPVEFPEKPESYASEGFSYDALQNNRLAYDRYLAYADSEFGRLVNAMEEADLFDNTIVILTSDHGELFERGIRGHVTPVLYEPLIRVPLIISLPGIKTRQDVFSPTCTIDILPTLAQLLGQPIPAWSEGQILPVIGGAKPDWERSIFLMDSKYSPKSRQLTYGTFAVIQGGYKLIQYRGEPAQPEELYDLEDDPEELTNLARDEPGIANDLRELLSAKLNQT